jgi:hypothetical protein
VSDPGYLRLRGGVASDVALEGDDAGAVVVWVTAVDGETCVEVDELTFVPHLLAYEVEISGPPRLDGEPCVPTPADWGDPLPFAVGALALVDPERGRTVEVTADPLSLLGWFAGEAVSLGELLAVDGGRVAAVALEHALMATTEAPSVGTPYCRFERGIPGLVLYDDRGSGCGGWVPLAEPGERTEFQGVDLSAP